MSEASTNEGDSTDDFVRINFSIQSRIEENILDPLADKYFDGNRSRAIRASIQAEKVRREDDVDTVELKIMRNNVEKILDSIQELDEKIETDLAQTQALTTGIQDPTRLEVSTGVGGQEKSGPNDSREIADIIRAADNPLSIGEISTRSDCELPVLHTLLEKLLDAGIISTEERGDGSLRYRPASAGGDR